ncbi:hypothetical protein B0H13DRAFT_2362292 [Mycena leptocephala]|nr:hypothetical protein B0H13DRAFT_2362292 [Mycena leptocephala]
MANSAAILSTSLPLNKKLKPELQAIARALGITDNATVPSLRKSINEHIRNHAEIADDPRFLPLLAHRSGPNTVTKNSADKLAEEASKPGVPGQAATGANKTLLTNNVKTDPAPQFAKLSSGSRTGPITTDTKDDANEDCESTSSDSGSSISPEPEPESEEKPKKTPRQQLPRNLPVVVRVNFFDEHNQAAAPRQVCVLANDIPITALAAKDGSTEYVTSLSELLPAAFQNDSPIKGMLFTNTFQSRSLTVRQCRSLKIDDINDYTLRTSPGGGGFCDVFWDQSSQAIGGEITGTLSPAVADSGDGVNQGPMAQFIIDSLPNLSPVPNFQRWSRVAWTNDVQQTLVDVINNLFLTLQDFIANPPPLPATFLQTEYTGKPGQTM